MVQRYGHWQHWLEAVHHKGCVKSIPHISRRKKVTERQSVSKTTIRDWRQIVMFDFFVELIYFTRATPVQVLLQMLPITQPISIKMLKELKKTGYQQKRSKARHIPHSETPASILWTVSMCHQTGWRNYVLAYLGRTKGGCGMGVINYTHKYRKLLKRESV